MGEIEKDIKGPSCPQGDRKIDTYFESLRQKTVCHKETHRTASRSCSPEMSIIPRTKSVTKHQKEGEVARGREGSFRFSTNLEAGSSTLPRGKG